MEANRGVMLVPGGTVTSVPGFLAGATFAGIKTYSEDKLDLGILLSPQPCVSGGVFSTNCMPSPSLVLTREHIRSGRVRAVVVESGVANTSVGEPGMKDAREIVSLASEQLGLPLEEVAFLSTGIIGVELPMALIRASLPRVEPTESGGDAFARAIMTTDTHPKEAAVSYQWAGRAVTLAGAAKGSGMIHPDMATMLAFLATDAPLEPAFLQESLKKAADRSFNMVTIDGDNSPNDSLLLLANGAAGGPLIHRESEEAELFQEALTGLCVHLAKELVRDGEGATKLFEVTVEGAHSDTDARMAARTITSSNLVKTAVHGNDPNWGRIIAALGRSGAAVEEEKVALYVNDVCILENGCPIPFFRDAIVLLMKNPEVSFRIDLHLGQGRAIAWGCDLTESYVTFNSAYTT